MFTSIASALTALVLSSPPAEDPNPFRYPEVFSRMMLAPESMTGKQILRTLGDVPPSASEGYAVTYDSTVTRVMALRSRAVEVYLKEIQDVPYKDRYKGIGAHISHYLPETGYTWAHPNLTPVSTGLMVAAEGELLGLASAAISLAIDTGAMDTNYGIAMFEVVNGYANARPLNACELQDTCKVVQFVSDGVPEHAITGPQQAGKCGCNDETPPECVKTAECMVNVTIVMPLRPGESGKTKSGSQPWTACEAGPATGTTFVNVQAGVSQCDGSTPTIRLQKWSSSSDCGVSTSPPKDPEFAGTLKWVCGANDGCTADCPV